MTAHSLPSIKDRKEKEKKSIWWLCATMSSREPQSVIYSPAEGMIGFDGGEVH
jgi:hypothetical protein